MKNFLAVLAIMTFAIAFIAGVWWLFYYLWNSIVAGVLGAPELTFWQSVGLLVLVGILTGGLRGSFSSK